VQNDNHFFRVYLRAGAAAVLKILFSFSLVSRKEEFRVKRQKGSVESNKVAKYLFCIWNCVKKEKRKSIQAADKQRARDNAKYQSYESKWS
jgi:hypothetical protein